MKRHWLVGLCLALLTSTALAAPAQSSLRVEQAWIRLLPGDLPSAAYLEIHNDGDQPRRLISASSASFNQIMLHQSLRTSGTQHMRELQSVEIPAHSQARFEPGGYHLMLMGRQQSLKVGDSVAVLLHFADGESLSSLFQVRAANSAP